MEKFLISQHKLIIRDPLTKKPLDEKGEMKPFTGSAGRYWRRRVNDGSVKIISNQRNVEMRRNNKRYSREVNND